MDNKINMYSFNYYFTFKPGNKKIFGLENADDYIDYLNNLPLQTQSFLFLYELNKHINQISMTRSNIKKISRKGNYLELENYLLEKLKSDKQANMIYTIFYRNKVQKKLLNIEQILKNKSNNFIIIDIYFLIGKYGLLNQMEENGYKFNQIN